MRPAPGLPHESNPLTSQDGNQGARHLAGMLINHFQNAGTLAQIEPGRARPEAEALVARVRGNFERLGAMPWLRRVHALEREGAAA